MGSRRILGHAFRPTSQAPVERAHQETQRLLGITVLSVFKAFPGQWGELLPVVEFLLCNTPQRNTRLTPRDLDKAWSLSTSLLTRALGMYWSRSRGVTIGIQLYQVLTFAIAIFAILVAVHEAAVRVWGGVSLVSRHVYYAGAAAGRIGADRSATGRFEGQAAARIPH